MGHGKGDFANLIKVTDLKIRKLSRIIQVSSLQSHEPFTIGVSQGCGQERKSERCRRRRIQRVWAGEGLNPALLEGHVERMSGNADSRQEMGGCQSCKRKPLNVANNLNEQGRARGLPQNPQEGTRPCFEL